MQSRNVGLSVGWLARLFFRRRPEFHRLRRAAVLTTLGAQPVFLLFPTAPPRTLDHFVDTIAEVSGFDLDSGLVAKLYDPIAAMPSIHVAYAVVTATGIAETSRSPLARAPRARLSAARGAHGARDREPLRPRCSRGRRTRRSRACGSLASSTARRRSRSRPSLPPRAGRERPPRSRPVSRAPRTGSRRPGARGRRRS